MNKISQSDINKLKKISSSIRRTTLDIIYKTSSPHIGPSFSIVEILTYLYFYKMKINRHISSDKRRDKLILSKGHACAALYATLFEKKIISRNTLCSFAVCGGELQHHPDRTPNYGIEITTGSLGHGLSIAAGMSLSDKIDNIKRNIFVIMSDGELNEGSSWEAALFAGHHKLSNLTAFVDYNKMQALGKTNEVLDLEPLPLKWQSFGWETREANGHDFYEIDKAITSMSKSGRPKVVILHTIKGKGVSFMEDNLLWHYRAPDEKEYQNALKEINRNR